MSTQLLRQPRPFVSKPHHFKFRGSHLAARLFLRRVAPTAQPSKHLPCLAHVSLATIPCKTRLCMLMSCRIVAHTLCFARIHRRLVTCLTRITADRVGSAQSISPPHVLWNQSEVPADSHRPCMSSVILRRDFAASQGRCRQPSLSSRRPARRLHFRRLQSRLGCSRFSHRRAVFQ